MKKYVLIIGILFLLTSCVNSFENKNINNKIEESSEIINLDENLNNMKKEKINKLIQSVQTRKEQINNNEKVLEVNIIDELKIKEEKVIQNSILKITNVINISFKQNGDNIEILLDNPEKKIIQSVRTWISFKQGALKITELNLNNTVFDLAAPDEYLVDKENWIIKIGLSSTKGVGLEHINIWSFNIENKTTNPVLLSCYDYSLDSDSHCTVIEAETSQNILNEPNSILIN